MFTFSLGIKSGLNMGAGIDPLHQQWTAHLLKQDVLRASLSAAQPRVLTDHQRPAA
jgi:hypothetical protein